MGLTDRNGRPFSPTDQERLSRALLSLTREVAAAPPEELSGALLQAWHRRLSADLDVMEPGRYRVSDITFGSFFGARAADIQGEMARWLSGSQATLSDLTAAWATGGLTEPGAQGVLRHATWMHAELLRLHPFADGNGRLARLVQAWVCFRFGLHPPVYQNRARYLAGLNRYHHTRDLDLLWRLTLDSLRDLG